MDLRNSTLDFEVNAIASAGQVATMFDYSAELICGGKPVTPVKILGIDIVRDYRRAYLDEIVVECAFWAGDFLYDVLPYKSNISMVIYTTPVGEVSGADNLGLGIGSEYYKATMLSPTDERMSSRFPQFTSREAANHTGVARIKFQLQSPAAERIRLWSVGVPVLDQTPGDTLRGIFSAVSKAVNLQLTDKIKGVEMFPPNNQEKRKHILIPHGMKLHQVPHYIQNKCGGIYSAGLGFYLQNLVWYIWPLYDLKRHAQARESLTFIIISPNQLNSTEKTWRSTEKQTIVLITGGAQHLDNTEESFYNQGSGVRFTKASSVVSSPGVATDDNRFIVSRGDNNQEFNAIERGPNLINAQVSARRVTDNLYRESSDLAARAGSYFEMSWQHSRPDLIKPDAAVKVMYADSEGLPIEVNGTLIETHTRVMPARQGTIDNRFYCVTKVVVFLEKDLPEAVEYFNSAPPDEYTSSAELQ